MSGQLETVEELIVELEDSPDTSGLDIAAAKALRTLLAERNKAREDYQFMVERAADEKLDGYRELGDRAAAAEIARDKALEWIAILSERLKAYDGEEEHLPPMDTFQPSPRGTTENDRMRSASGTITDRDPLVAFLYVMGRDLAPIGSIEGLLEKIDCKGVDVVFTNGWLAQWARDAANRLRIEEGSE